MLLAGGVVAAPAASAAPVTSAAPSSCRPAVPDIVAPTTDFYDPARPELGPAVLPDGPLMYFYRRTGGLDDAAFEAKYRSGAGWVYPPDDGFLSIAGHVLDYRQRLVPGTHIDRFGYPGGAFLAPAGLLFAQRALPPQNLTTPVGTTRSNYHLYCVVIPFDVEAGPIAPWFEQPGLGWQYQLRADFVPASNGVISVSWLLQNGYLVEERPA